MFLMRRLIRRNLFGYRQVYGSPPAPKSVFKKAENRQGRQQARPKAKKSYPRIACQHIFDEPFGLSDLTGASPSAPLRTEILSQICADRCSQF